MPEKQVRNSDPRDKDSVSKCADLTKCDEIQGGETADYNRSAKPQKRNK